MQVWPTASDSFSRKLTPLNDMSRVRMSWVEFAVGPSSTVSVAFVCSGRRLSRRRSRSALEGNGIETVGRV